MVVYYIETHFLTLIQGIIAGLPEGCYMDEGIADLIRCHRNKTISFGLIEPFHNSNCHDEFPLLKLD